MGTSVLFLAMEEWMVCSKTQKKRQSKRRRERKKKTKKENMAVVVVRHPHLLTAPLLNQIGNELNASNWEPVVRA